MRKKKGDGDAAERAKIRTELDKEPTRKIVGTLNLTHAIWSLIRRDAEAEDRSESYIVGAILGEHWGLDSRLSNPNNNRKQGKA